MSVGLWKTKHKWWKGLNLGFVWFKMVTNDSHCLVMMQALLHWPPCLPCLLSSLCVWSVTDLICSSFLWPKVCSGIGACLCLCKSENMHVWIHALTVCMHLYLITCMSVCGLCVRWPDLRYGYVTDLHIFLFFSSSEHVFFCLFEPFSS